MKKKYKIEVDCAGCAQKIEDAASKVTGVTKLSVNAIAGKMIVEFADGADVDVVMKDVVAAAKKVEPDCEIEL